MLKNEGIIIPIYLIKLFFKETEDSFRPQEKEDTPPQKRQIEKNSLITSDTPGKDS